MSRKDREMQQYRNDGMAYAYKIAKEKGIEALEKEIKYRKATFLPSAVQEKDVTKFVDETKENNLGSFLHFLYLWSFLSLFQLSHYFQNLLLYYHLL